MHLSPLSLMTWHSLNIIKDVIVNSQIHLVMMRYTLDSSPLDEAEDYAEMVRGVFADREKAQIVVDELESTNGAEDVTYFVDTRSVVL